MQKVPPSRGLFLYEYTKALAGQSSRFLLKNARNRGALTWFFHSANLEYRISFFEFFNLTGLISMADLATD